VCAEISTVFKLLSLATDDARRYPLAEEAPTRAPDTQLFRDVFNASPIGIAVETFEGQPLFVNPAFCSFLGFSEQELRHKHCLDFSPPEDAEKDWALFQQLRAGSIDHYQLEKRYFRRDGSLVWGRLSLSLLSSRPSPLVIAMVEDITDKRSSLDREHDLLETLNLVTKQMPAAVTRCSRDLRYLWVNQGYADWLQRPLDEIAGRPISDVLGKAAFDALLPHFQRVLDGENVHHEQETSFHGIGKRWISATYTPTLAADGAANGWVAVVLDITERKRAEEARFRHAAIVESNQDAIISKGMNAAITSWNIGAERVFGYTEAEVIGQPITILIPPELCSEENHILERLETEERIEHYETKRVTKAGEIIDVVLTIVPMKDSTGRALGYTNIAHNITHQKVTQEALRASEERLRLAQLTARIGTFERNLRTGVVTWTPEMESLYGLPPGGFGGTITAFEDLVHPEDRAGLIDLVDHSKKTGLPTTGEWRAVWPDGSIHWIGGRWQVFMNEAGEPSRVVGANIDITERKAAENAILEVNRTLTTQAALLQSREELLKIFVKNVPAGVAMFDRDMRYLQVSDRWCADYSVDSSQVLGRTQYDVFPDLPQRWREHHRRGLEGETLGIDEDRWDRGDGTTSWVHWEIRPWRTDTGIVGGILIFAEDITHHKMMENALAEISRKLIQSQEQERARIGRELHDDINQRLAMLAIELQQLQDHPSELHKRVQELRQHTTDISGDVQALSHELHSSKLEYLGVVAGIRSWCKEFGEHQGMEINFKTDAAAPIPLEIGLTLFRILQEALHNAVKHSGVERVDVQLSEHSNEIRLTISDAGKGFDVEAARQGRGLGLASMEERVRLVNGTISIASKPMVGTSIRILVPRKSDRIAELAAG
jgi:PAS domain S-box-containing protein